MEFTGIISQTLLNTKKIHKNKTLPTKPKLSIGLLFLSGMCSGWFRNSGEKKKKNRNSDEVINLPDMKRS